MDWLSEAVATLPFAFWLGYGAILLVPGPNVMIVSATAAARGLRGALPFIGGLAAGASTLCAASSLLAMAAHSREGMEAALAPLSALLLFAGAWRILSLNCAKPGCPPMAGAPRLDIALGFLTALTNPLTGAYFLARFLAAKDAAQPAEIAVKVAGVAAVAALMMTAYAVLFSRPSARRRIQAHFDALKVAAAALVGILGFGSLLPLAHGARLFLPS